MGLCNFLLSKAAKGGRPSQSLCALWWRQPVLALGRAQGASHKSCGHSMWMWHTMAPRGSVRNPCDHHHRSEAWGAVPPPRLRWGLIQEKCSHPQLAVPSRADVCPLLSCLRVMSPGSVSTGLLTCWPPPDWPCCHCCCCTSHMLPEPRSTPVSQTGTTGGCRCCNFTSPARWPSLDLHCLHHLWDFLSSGSSM